MVAESLSDFPRLPDHGACARRVNPFAVSERFFAIGETTSFAGLE